MSLLWKRSALRAFVRWSPLLFGGTVLFFLFCFYNAPVQKTFLGFDTFVEVELPKRYAGLFPEIESLIHRYDGFWNRFSSQSLVSRINNSHSWVAVDGETFHLLKETFALSEKTHGMFCPLVGNLIDLWGFPHSPRVPESWEIERELRTIHESTIMFDEGKRAVVLVGKAELDLGGVAKGYLVDLLVRFLREKGVERFLINAGGTVFGIGKSWKVGILHPREGKLLGRITINGLCVSTSADSFRFFEEHGKRYHHIINPFTGYPGSAFVSVTVVAPSGILADVLSTALMAGDEVFFTRITQEFPEISVLAVKENGEILTSPGMQKIFEAEHAT